MEKKIFVGLTALGLLALMVTSLFHLGNREPLNGSWTEYEKPELCAEAWMDGSYQTDLENYTAANYSMHNFNTRIYNQIRYSAFRTSNSVVIGKENCYFEASYLKEALGTDADILLTDQEIEALAQQICDIQKAARAQGKGFIYVITPSKADYRREDIPQSYLAKTTYYAPEERNYIRLMEAFDRLGVCYLDSNEVLQNTERPVFYNSGTHWNRMSAVLVMNEILARLQQEYGIRVKPLEMPDIGVKDDSDDDQDQDLAEMLNTFWAATDSQYYEANEQAVFDSGYDTPRMFVQGGSFTNKLMEISRDNCLFSELHRMFYGISMQDYNRGGGADTKDLLNSDAFRYAVQDADIIMLETNVENVSNLQPEIYERIYENLCSEKTEHEESFAYAGVYGEENDGSSFRWASPHMLYEVKLPEKSETLQIQLELPIAQLKEANGDQLDQTMQIYANGNLIAEADYTEDVINLQIPVSQIETSGSGDIDIMLEIVTPYSFCPADSGSTDTRKLAYKIRRIGGE